MNEQTFGKVKPLALVAIIVALSTVGMLAVIAQGAASANSPRSVDTTVRCVQEAGYPDFTPQGPTTLKDGTIFQPDESGRFRVTPATVELTNTIVRCESPDAPPADSVQPGTPRIAFLNEYHAGLFACMEAEGWEIGAPVRDLAGFDVYGRPDLGPAVEVQWKQDVSGCEERAYGTPGFPHHLMPAN